MRASRNLRIEASVLRGCRQELRQSRICYLGKITLVAGVLSSASALPAETAHGFPGEGATPIVQVAQSNKNTKPKKVTKSFIKIPNTIIYYANEPSGYVMGNATDGDAVVFSGIEEKDHHKRIWGLAMVLHPGQPEDDECAWIKERPVRESKDIRIKYEAGICEDKIKWLADRDNIGKGFNGKEHEKDDGSHETDMRDSCEDDGWPLNYNQKTGRAYDILPPLEKVGSFKFRYATPDGAKSIGRVTLLLPKDDTFIEEDVWSLPSEWCTIGKRLSGPELDYGIHADS